MLKKLKLNAKDWILNHKKRFSEDEGLKRLTMCKKCYTFYYKNSWHFEKPNYFEESYEEEVPVRFTECPPCIEQELALYETESDLIFGKA